jgi:hypothetical protein
VALNRGRRGRMFKQRSLRLCGDDAAWPEIIRLLAKGWSAF